MPGINVIDIHYQGSSSRSPMAVRLQHQLVCLSLAALTMFVSACATQSSVARSSNIQSALVQAGFKSKSAATAQQQRHLQSLPEHEFTLVKQNGQNFYVWADKPNNRLYCGSEQAYRNYKEIRKAQYDRESGAITWIDDFGGTSVPVTIFYGWSPFNDW